MNFIIKAECLTVQLKLIVHVIMSFVHLVVAIVQVSGSSVG